VDHAQQLGPALDLFSIEESAGPGLIFWHPKGAILRQILEDFWRDEHQRAGYQHVATPHVARDELWRLSGHLDYYRDNMYQFEIAAIDNKPRQFHTYWARGASFTGVDDDGTICPSAAAASIAFAPELVVPTLLSLRETYGDHIYAEYGFLDALNPTFQLEVPVQHGKVVPGVGWFDTDYLGIDQGPILAMIENWRSGLVWRTMRANSHVARGLRAAGFSGGWLDSLGVAP